MKKTLLLLPVFFGAVLLSGCSTESASTSTTTMPITSQKTTASEKNIETKNVSAPNVKKSSSGICHGEGTTYYNQTKKFTAYDSIDECLDSGGRMPLK